MLAITEHGSDPDAPEDLKVAHTGNRLPVSVCFLVTLLREMRGNMLWDAAKAGWPLVGPAAGAVAGAVASKLFGPQPVGSSSPENAPAGNPSRSGSGFDSLPYFIRDARTNRQVPVCFEPMTRDTVPELEKSHWMEIWDELFWARAGPMWKLVCAECSDGRLQGLVLFGSVRSPGEPVRASVLEAAPHNRYGASNRQHCGVGKVLVARLIVESQQRGGNGTVLGTPPPGATAFLKRIGFREIPSLKSGNGLFPHYLDREAAEGLLKSVMLRWPAEEVGW
jgi:hypothetical protein